MNHYLESVSNKYFYQDIGGFKINSDYLDEVKKVLSKSWEVMRSGIYIYFKKQGGPSIPVQGWKIHVSSNIKNAKSILKVVADYANEESFSFKFIADNQLHSISTQKPYPRSQSGKFITIYPKDEEQFTKVIENLYLKLKDMDGPYILTDKRYKDSKVLYYRYGGMTSIKKLKFDGSLEYCIFDREGNMIPDERNPFYKKPDFVKEPFVFESNDNFPNPLLDSYKDIQPIRFTNSGGVYNAIAKETNQEVIIKEARPYTCMYLTVDKDAIDYRKFEKELFNQLEHHGFTPKVLDSFYVWEHYFLVVEKIEGLTLREYVNKYSPFSFNQVLKEDINNYLDSIITIFINLLKVVSTIHDEGIVLSDLSLENIMITNDLEVKLIDLEASFYRNQPPEVNMSTIKNDKLLTNQKDFLEFDYYTLGIILYESLLQRSDLANFSINTIMDSLNELVNDFNLPNQFIEVIQKLIDIELPLENKNLNNIIKIMQSIESKETSIDDSLVVINSDNNANNYTEIINSQIKHMVKSLDNPDSSLKTYTPKINNNVNMGYGLLGVRHYLNTTDTKYDFSNFDNYILYRGVNDKELPPGLFNGLSGMALTMLLSGKKIGAKEILDLSAQNHMLTHSHSYFNGITGYGMTLLKFWEELQEEQYLERAKKVGDYLIRIHKEDRSGNIYWPSLNGDTEIGLFFGSTGVSLLLLYLYLATNQSKYLQYGERALFFDLSKKSKSNKGYLGFPRDTSTTSTVVPYFGYGTAGILSVVIRYYAATKKEKYKKIIDELAPLIDVKYAAFPGLFDGLAGLANTMLDLHQFLEKEEYKHRAKTIIDGILLFKIEINNNIYFPGDHLKKFSLDLGGGSAGICATLERYINNGNNLLFFNDSLIFKKVGEPEYEDKKILLQPSI